MAIKDNQTQNDAVSLNYDTKRLNMIEFRGNPNLISLASPEKMKMRISYGEAPGYYNLKFIPSNETKSYHGLQLLYNNKKMKNGEFSLLPSTPKIKSINADERYIQLSGVADHTKLHFANPAFFSKVEKIKEHPDQARLYFNMPENGIHDAYITYRNQKVPESDFRMVPSELQDAYENNLINLNADGTAEFIQNRPAQQQHVPNAFIKEIDSVNVSDLTNRVNKINIAGQAQNERSFKQQPQNQKGNLLYSNRPQAQPNYYAAPPAPLYAPPQQQQPVTSWYFPAGYGQ
jgi:hypothetical protein